VGAIAPVVKRARAAGVAAGFSTSKKAG
jgi:hypothetical protein